jgi:hypothetical protein
VTSIGVASWPFILAALVRAEEPLTSGEVARRASKLSRGECSVLPNYVREVLDDLASKGLVNNVGDEGRHNGWIVTGAGRERWREMVEVLGPVFGENNARAPRGPRS